MKAYADATISDSPFVVFIAAGGQDLVVDTIIIMLSKIFQETRKIFAIMRSRHYGWRDRVSCDETSLAFELHTETNNKIVH